MNYALILAQIPTLVRALEEVIPESGKGASKLDAIKAAISATVDETELPEFVSKYWPRIVKYINLVVMLLNVVGIFKK